MYREKPTHTLTLLYEVQKAAILSHKVKNKNTNPNLRCSNRTNGDKIDTLDTLTLLFTFLTGFIQYQDSYPLKSDSTHHFFRNACTKSGSLRFSQFSGCSLSLSVYILMSIDFPFVRLFGVR